MGYKTGPANNSLFFAVPFSVLGIPDAEQLSNFAIANAVKRQKMMDLAYSSIDYEYFVGFEDDRRTNGSTQADFYGQRCAINEWNQLKLLNHDRTAEVASDVNIPIDVTDDYEGSWNIGGMAHNSQRNEFFGVYTFSDDFLEPDSSDLYGRRIAGSPPTGIENGKKETVAREFYVHQNYPNPFNPSTVISFTIPENEFVLVEVYDVMGRKITILLNEEKAAGAHTVMWDGTDAAGSSVASGVYLYKVQAGRHMSTNKMMLIH